MNLIPIFIILVGIFILTRKHGRLMDKTKLLSNAVAISVLITFSYGVSQILVTIATSGDLFNNQYVNLGTQIGQIVGGIFLIFLGSFNVATARTMMRNRSHPTRLSVEILEKSKPYLDGVLYFRYIFSGRLTDGYAVFTIVSPYNESYETTFHYDKNKKRGELSDEKDFSWKWRIPKNFSDGEYKAKLQFFSVITWWFFIPIRTKHLTKTQEFSVTIDEQAKNDIIIQKVIRPNIESLKGIDMNSKPLSGWICIKLYNNSDKTKQNCFGYIKTNIDQFPLYYYQSHIKNEKTEVDGYLSFPLEANSGKLLYANIKSNEKTIKITIDLGKEEISTELPLNFV